MDNRIYSVIVGTGCYIPAETVPNESFLQREFCDADGQNYDKSNEEIIASFQKITGITERRYVTEDLVSSDIAFFAAREALESSGVDKEGLDYIIVAHNFGDVQHGNRRSDFVPSLASRVKHKLGIENPHTVGYDIAFGDEDLASPHRFLRVLENFPKLRLIMAHFGGWKMADVFLPSTTNLA